MYYPRRSPLETAAYLFVMALILVTIFLAWPMIQTRIAGAPGREQATPYPTRPAYRPVPEQPAIAPVDAIANYNATAEAQYRAVIQQPAPNVNTTNDNAPVMREQIVTDRQPAPAVVPIVEPIPDTQSDDTHGSKAVIVNPQETHQCLHGAVWTDAGCKYPTPVQ